MGFWKKIGEAFATLKTQESAVYAKINPDHPHAGLDLFSETNDFGMAIKITGVSIQDAMTKLCGRVIAWDEMTENEKDAAKSGRLSLNMDQFTRHLR